MKTNTAPQPRPLPTPELDALDRELGTWRAQLATYDARIAADEAAIAAASGQQEVAQRDYEAAGAVYRGALLAVKREMAERHRSQGNPYAHAAGDSHTTVVYDLATDQTTRAGATLAEAREAWGQAERELTAALAALNAPASRLSQTRPQRTYAAQMAAALEARRAGLLAKHAARGGSLGAWLTSLRARLGAPLP